MNALLDAPRSFSAFRNSVANASAEQVELIEGMHASFFTVILGRQRADERISLFVGMLQL